MKVWVDLVDKTGCYKCSQYHYYTKINSSCGEEELWLSCSISHCFFPLGHAECVDFMRRYNVPLLLLGGGGYTIRNVARCWTYETAVALNCEIANGRYYRKREIFTTLSNLSLSFSLPLSPSLFSELPYNDYFEYFGPDFKLHISPTNMTNQNTLDYLNKIKARLFENLRLIPHAPSVQMQRESS